MRCNNLDNNKILDDDNLNELGFIKKIDTYAIVDKEFDKKREWKKVFMVIGVSVFIIVTSILSIMIGIVFNSKIIISKELMDKILLKGAIAFQKTLPPDKVAYQVHYKQRLPFLLLIS